MKAVKSPMLEMPLVANLWTHENSNPTRLVACMAMQKFNIFSECYAFNLFVIIFVTITFNIVTIRESLNSALLVYRSRKLVRNLSEVWAVLNDTLES